MKRSILATSIIGLLLIILAIGVSKNFIFESKKEETKHETILTAEEKYQLAMNKETDLVFWYDDATYETYFYNAAISFYEEKGLVVKPCYIDEIDYVGSIYDATMKELDFPDAYLLSGEELEKAYLYGVAKENQSGDLFEDVVAKNAIHAATCGETLYGYPLSYNVCLFAYNKEAFQEAPESLQAIIDFSKENEPDENVEYLLEWDVNDPFYNFLFVSESVVVEKTEVGVMKTSYNDALLEASLSFLQESLESFSIPIKTVTEQSVLLDVSNGKTLCAIVDSSSMKAIARSGYEVIPFPKLNDEIGAKTVALTDLIVVNDYSEKAQIADEFARYLCLDFSKQLWGLSGNCSVKLQENATNLEKISYEVYEEAILSPNSQDEGGFWVDLNNMIKKYFET